MSRDVRRAVLHASAMGAVFGVWYVWGVVVGGSSSPLVGYYQAYETSAFGYLGTDPALAARIVAWQPPHGRGRCGCGPRAELRGMAGAGCAGWDGPYRCCGAAVSVWR